MKKREIPRYILVLGIIGFCANLFDLITTYFCLKNPTSFESNPFFALLLNKPILAYSIKLLVGTYVFLPFKGSFYYTMMYFAEGKPKIIKIYSILIVMVWVILASFFMYVAFVNTLIIFGIKHNFPSVYAIVIEKFFNKV